MARYKRFTFMCDAEERKMIAAIADRLQRSQSDAVRLVVREAARDIDAAPSADKNKGIKGVPANGNISPADCGA